MYKSTFHPQLPNMGFVGMYRGPLYGGYQVTGQWISLIFSKQKSLPSEATMQEGLWTRTKRLENKNPAAISSRRLCRSYR